MLLDRNQRLQRGRRRGVLMAVALAILATVAALSLGTVRRLAVNFRVDRGHEWRAQAAWLADAGIGRAAALLRANPNYRGETWPIAADELPHGEPGEVQITVSPADSPGRWTVQVAAVYPAHPLHRAAVRKTIEVANP